MDLSPIKDKLKEGFEWTKQKLDEHNGQAWEKLKEAAHWINEIGRDKVLGALVVSSVVIISVVASRRQRAKTHSEEILEALHVESHRRFGGGFSCLIGVVALALVDGFLVQPKRWSKRTKKGIRAAVLAAVLALSVCGTNHLSPPARGHPPPAALILMYLAVGVGAIASAHLSLRVLLYPFRSKQANRESQSEADPEPTRDVEVH